MTQDKPPGTPEIKQKERLSLPKKMVAFLAPILAGLSATALIVPKLSLYLEDRYVEKEQLRQSKAYEKIQEVNKKEITLSKELLGISALTQAQKEGQISLKLDFDLKKRGKLAFKDLEGKEQEIGSYTPGQRSRPNEKSKPINWMKFPHLSLNLRGEQKEDFIQRSSVDLVEEIDKQNRQNQTLIINISATYPDEMECLIEELAKRGYAHFGLNQRGKQTYIKDEVNRRTDRNTKIEIGSSAFIHQSLLDGMKKVQATVVPSPSGKNQFTEIIMKSEEEKEEGAGKKEVLENVMGFSNNATLIISGVVTLPDGRKKLIIDAPLHIAHDSTSEERLTDLLTIAQSIFEIAAKYEISEEDIVIIATGDTNTPGFFTGRQRIGNVQAIERQERSLNPKLPEKIAINVKNLVKKLSVVREAYNLLGVAALQTFAGREDELQSKILAKFGEKFNLHLEHNGNTFTGSDSDSPIMRIFLRLLNFRSMQEMGNYETYSAVFWRPNISDHHLVKYFTNLTAKRAGKPSRTEEGKQFISAKSKKSQAEAKKKTPQLKESNQPFSTKLKEVQKELRQTKEWMAVQSTLAIFLISFVSAYGALVALKNHVTDYSSAAPSQEQIRHQYETPVKDDGNGDL